MHLVTVVLFAHVVVAILAFCVAAVLHTAQWASRGATDAAALRVWGPIVHRLEPWFPILALALFALGAWLLGLSDGEFRWGDGWVVTATVGLAVMEAVGGVVIAPRSKRLVKAIGEAPDGPLAAELRDAFFEPVFWAATHFATGVALGIVYLMTAKPSAAVSIAVVVAAGLVAAAVGARGARAVQPHLARPTPAAETA